MSDDVADLFPVFLFYVILRVVPKDLREAIFLIRRFAELCSDRAATQTVIVSLFLVILSTRRISWCHPNIMSHRSAPGEIALGAGCGLTSRATSRDPSCTQDDNGGTQDHKRGTRYEAKFVAFHHRAMRAALTRLALRSQSKSDRMRRPPSLTGSERGEKTKSAEKVAAIHNQTRAHLGA